MPVFRAKTAFENYGHAITEQSVLRSLCKCALICIRCNICFRSSCAINHSGEILSSIAEQDEDEICQIFPSLNSQWNIVESGVKHHNSNCIVKKQKHIFQHKINYYCLCMRWISIIIHRNTELLEEWNIYLELFRDGKIWQISSSSCSAIEDNISPEWLIAQLDRKHISFWRNIVFDCRTGRRWNLPNFPISEQFQINIPFF
jgi:hypothetical protein